MATQLPRLTLSNGLQFPNIGYGTGGLTDAEILKKSLAVMIESGYRYIDTAQTYTNEHIIGEFLDETIKSGKLKRKDIFITSKPIPGPQLTIPEYMAKIAKGEIETDLTPHIETWRVLEKFYKQGVFKAIGISNFNEKQIQDLYDKAEIKPQNLQVECHVYCQTYDLHEFCKKLGIVVTSYSTLGNPGRPAHYKKEGDQDPLKHPYVLELAQKYKKDPAQILLRQTLQRGIAVIPKSTNPVRIRSNKEVFDFELTEAEMEKFKAIKDDRRFFDLEALKNHPYYPFK